MVDGIEDIPVCRDAFVVVEVAQGLFEHNNQSRLGLGWGFAVRYEYVGAVNPSSLRSQPRGV